MAPTDAKRAEVFNTKAIAMGAVTPHHLVDLAESFQSGHGFLEVDGMIGPSTRVALEALREPAWLQALDDGARIMARALELTLAELGEGETQGNNKGPRIDFWRETDGTGIGLTRKNAWCGVLRSSCFVRAAEELELELGFKTSRNAKRLGDNVGEAGRFLDVPEPGCLVVWHRGFGRQGHVGACVSYDPATDSLTTVDGNKLEPRPRRSRRAKVAEFYHPAGIWREDLYCLSTLALEPAG